MPCHAMPCSLCCVLLSHAILRDVYKPVAEVALHIMCQQQQCSCGFDNTAGAYSYAQVPMYHTVTHLVCLPTEHCSAAEPALAAGQQLP